MVYVIHCKDCKSVVVAKGANRKYCDSCIKEKNRRMCQKRYVPVELELYTCELCDCDFNSRTMPSTSRWTVCPDCRRSAQGRWNRYRISPDEYMSLYEAQNRTCALCEEDEKLHVDHCHETGRIRGLLCPKHNIALGALGDTEQAVRSLLQYVTETDDSARKK
jgi:hypothetical protein